MKSIIVDANKVFAAFIVKGIVHDLLFSGKFVPVGPEKLAEELKRNTEYVAKKSGMKVDDVKLAITLLEPEFKIFKIGEYSDKLKEALRIVPHEKDVEYFALAVKFGFPIWSNEKSFKEQSRVEILETKDVSKMIGKSG